MTQTPAAPANDARQIDDTITTFHPIQWGYDCEPSVIRDVPFEAVFLAAIATIVLGIIAVTLGWQFSLFLLTAIIIKIIGDRSPKIRVRRSVGANRLLHENSTSRARIQC